MKREPQIIAKLKGMGCDVRDVPGGRALTVGGATVTDDGLAGLEDVAGIREITVLPAPKVTPAGMARLAAVRGVTRLSLTHVDDALAAPFAAMHDLRELAIDGQGMTDAGLSFVSGMTDLDRLELHATKNTGSAASINGAGLSYLKGLKTLTTVAISGESIDDTAMENLGGIRSIRTLSLERVHISDGGLSHLENLKNLEALTVHEAPIRGGGLESLSSLPKLKSVDLSGCSLTNSGVGQLHGEAIEELHLGQTPVGDYGLSSWPIFLRSSRWICAARR